MLQYFQSRTDVSYGTELELEDNTDRLRVVRTSSLVRRVVLDAEGFRTDDSKERFEADLRFDLR